MTRLEELAQKHFPLVAYDEALEFGREILEECAGIAENYARATWNLVKEEHSEAIAVAIRALAEEGKGK